MKPQLFPIVAPDSDDSTIVVSRGVYGGGGGGNTQFTGINAGLQQGMPGMQLDSGSYPYSAVEANTLVLDVLFTSDDGAEGLLAIYLGGEVIGTIDERTAPDSMTSDILSLDDDFEPGMYQLSFRLDPYSDIASSVEIAHVSAFHAIPIPSTFALLTWCEFVVILRGIHRDFLGLARQLAHAPGHVVAPIVAAFFRSRARNHCFRTAMECASIATGHQYRLDLLAYRFEACGKTDEEVGCTEVLLDGIGWPIPKE